MGQITKQMEELREATSKSIEKIEFNWKSARCKMSISHYYGGALQSVQFNIVVEGKRTVFTVSNDGVDISGKTQRNSLKIIERIMLELEPLFGQCSKVENV